MITKSYECIKTIKCKIEGVTFNNEGYNTESRQQIIADLYKRGCLNYGTNLILKPEPSIQIDDHAVAVYAPDNRQIGYLPMAIAASISPKLLAGDHIKTIVETVSGGSNGFIFDISIIISIYEQKKVKYTSSDAEFDFNRAYQHFEHQKYSAAFYLLQQPAEFGHNKAQYYLGMCFDYGYGTDQNPREACVWYEAAAKQGNADAQGDLAINYYEGRGVAQNYQKALFWFEKAAAQNDANAIKCLGKMYEDGKAVQQDYSKAFGLYLKAAQLGHADAMHDVATAYLIGRGVEKDTKRAAFWNKKAALLLNASSIYNLAIQFLSGDGIQKDDQKSLHLLVVAARLGHPKAEQLLPPGTDISCYEPSEKILQRICSTSENEPSSTTTHQKTIKSAAPNTTNETASRVIADSHHVISNITSSSSNPNSIPTEAIVSNESHHKRKHRFAYLMIAVLIPLLIVLLNNTPKGRFINRIQPPEKPTIPSNITSTPSSTPTPSPTKNSKSASSSVSQKTNTPSPQSRPTASPSTASPVRVASTSTLATKHTSTAKPTPYFTPSPTATLQPVAILEYGQVIHFGKYQQDNNKSNGSEAIEWLVLSVEENRALLLSKYVLDCSRYNAKKENVTWEKSSLRSWLNSTFYNTAFSTEEKAAIQYTQLSNDASTGFADWNTSNGSSTLDYVFLLSYSDVAQYIPNMSDRIVQATRYAKSRQEDGFATSWWTRSAGKVQDSTLAIDETGLISYKYVTYYRGIRPAIYVDLSSFHHALK